MFAGIPYDETINYEKVDYDYDYICKLLCIPLHRYQGCRDITSIKKYLFHVQRLRGNNCAYQITAKTSHFDTYYRKMNCQADNVSYRVASYQ